MMNINKKTSDTTELIKLFSKIEELRMGYEDVLAFVYEGVPYMCNAHANSYTVGGKPAILDDFLKVKEEVEIELNCRGFSIHIRPPHKRKPKK